MKLSYAYWFMAFLFLASAPAFANDDEAKLNCKLTVRTTYKDGHAKVDVVEVHAESQKDCKRQGEAKRTTDDADVAKIIVSSGWRGDR